ncbi:MAG: lytic transglycosylase domain-containing protein [Proteobacteria bacterium]|nr:lytic transglycosylase domain-containing protein [Pseudomonadota bacterium]
MRQTAIIFCCLAWTAIASLAFGQGQAVNPFSDEETYGWTEAASYYRVSVEVLKALSFVESRGTATAINTANYNASTDRGHMQVNSVWKNKLPEGAWKYIHDPKYNTYVGAWVFRYYVDKFGNNWNAVCGYHTNHSLPELKAMADKAAKKAKALAATPGTPEATKAEASKKATEALERYKRGQNYVASVKKAVAQISGQHVMSERVMESADAGDSNYYGADDQPLKR